MNTQLFQQYAGRLSKSEYAKYTCRLIFADIQQNMEQCTTYGSAGQFPGLQKIRKIGKRRELIQPVPDSVGKFGTDTEIRIQRLIL